MRRDITIKSASLTGTSDLTIVAPIKKGFVPSLDAVTYKTRVQRVLRTLHVGRLNAHEYEFGRTLSDAVERVGRIHSIRIAVLEPEDKVLLAVTFDGSWESYIRVIWQKVSRSLDLIFCNTDDYVVGWTSTFEQWCVWLRSAQAQSSFLYAHPGLSNPDTQYLRMYERKLRREKDPLAVDLAALRVRIPTAEEISDKVGKDGTDPCNLGSSAPIDPVAAGRPAFRQGMASLAGLYRLTDLHLPGSDDGGILHRAACELLREFTPLLNNPSKYQQAIERAESRFKDALDWFRDATPVDRAVPALPDNPPTGQFADVQGGIVETYVGVSDGCLLLLAFDSPLALGKFLAATVPTRATDTIGSDHITVNLALSLEGLRLAGLGDDDIAALPAEFVQGMERRAGLLGDLRINHPRRWSLPPLNWAQGVNAGDVARDAPGPRVELGGVHLVLQLRVCNPTLASPDPRQKLLDEATRLLTGHNGARPLSLQWMRRLVNLAGQSCEHFGFIESQSQPVLKKSVAGSKYANRVHLGEVLQGYDNAADSASASIASASTLALLKNGSFLVVRKLRQDIGLLESALADAVKEALPKEDAAAASNAAAQALRKAAEDACRNLFLAKMMGRWPGSSAQAGEALATSLGAGGNNDFNFNGDMNGSLCPFHAHIRRTNPRDTSVPEPPGARPARIIRRGMSYGPPHDPAVTDSLAQERGTVFMAYNASIGEQFEVVQRWMTGGNSSGSYSGQSDPFMGIAEPGRKRFYRFEHDSQSLRIALDGSDRMHDEPHPIIRLEWGMYLFTPALSALKTLATQAAGAAGAAFIKSWSVREGEIQIARLQSLEQREGPSAAFDAWKAAIEDPTSASEFIAASIWAAIREKHEGVLRTPYGVLVASRDLVGEVLVNPARNLTATGYLPRMHRSFGTLYLGLDAGQPDQTYERESADVNRAIIGLVADKTAFDQAVDVASQFTRGAISAFAAQAEAYAKEDCETNWKVSLDAREIIDRLLGHFCEQWFGLSDKGGYLRKGGVHWTWAQGEPPSYPGHFMAPSRYTFQPHPGPEVERIGSEHGQALQHAITQYLSAYGSGLTAPVARAILDNKAVTGDATYPARTLAGVLMGFLPTTDGNLRRVLNEWLNDGTLWSLRARFVTLDKADTDAQKDFSKQFRDKLVSAMQLRAAPELLWRAAAFGHAIGKPGPHQVQVRAGEIVIASLISATQECLQAGDPSLHYAFGNVQPPPTPSAPPTHACPGYGPAMAVVFGFFRGLVESDQNLRPGPGALTVAMEGYAGLTPQCQSSVLEVEKAATGKDSGAAVASFSVHAASTIALMVIGDSWLTDLGDFLVPASLASRLRRLGYHYAGDESDDFRDLGRKLSQIADPAMTARIGQYLADMEGTSGKPRAILMGAGGNDLVDPPTRPRATALYRLLKAGATDAATALIEAEVKAFIDTTLFKHYVSILDVVTANSTAIPILIHAYDHPIPDGRRFEGIAGLGVRGPWLQKVFDAKNVTQDIDIRREIMKALIERLNKMVKGLETHYPGRVFHLKLNGELAKQPGYGQDYKTYWSNELHASAKGFDALAQVVKAQLVARGVT